LAETRAEEAQVRLAEVLEDFDPQGELSAEVEDLFATMQDVAVASAVSPLLHPSADLLGTVPRLVGHTGAGLVFDNLSSSTLVSASTGRQKTAVPRGEGQAVGSAKPAPSADVQLTAESVVRTGPRGRADASNLMMPKSAPSGTFDAVPWLSLDRESPEVVTGDVGLERRSSAGVARSLTSSPSGPASNSLSSTGVTSGSVLGGSDSLGLGGVESARPTTSQALPSRAPVPLAPNLNATAPEAPVLPYERPITRVNARFRDGARIVELGVARESDGIAVEVRAPRDFVAEIREMEGDIDAALRENGGEGLSSFDASAKDDYESELDGDSHEAASSSSADTTTDPPLIDPNRLLDRHV
jgi:hypothetical protein